MFDSANIGDLIKELCKNPINNYDMENYTVSRFQGSEFCGDAIDVYLKIDEKGLIQDYSWAGANSMVTIASASFLSEILIGKHVDEILKYDYNTLKKLGFEVSPRRQNTAVLPLAAVRNAIHEYKKDGLEDFGEDLLED